MSRKVISTCDMCGCTVNGEMAEIDVFNYYHIPTINLCEDCLVSFLLECKVDVNEYKNTASIYDETRNLRHK